MAIKVAREARIEWMVYLLPATRISDRLKFCINEISMKDLGTSKYIIIWHVYWTKCNGLLSADIVNVTASTIIQVRLPYLEDGHIIVCKNCKSTGSRSNRCSSSLFEKGAQNAIHEFAVCWMRAGKRHNCIGVL